VHFFFFLSLHAFPSKGAEAAPFFFFFLSLYAFPPKGALGYEVETPCIITPSSYMYAASFMNTRYLLYLVFVN